MQRAGPGPGTSTHRIVQRTTRSHNLVLGGYLPGTRVHTNYSCTRFPGRSQKGQLPGSGASIRLGAPAGRS